MGKKEKTQAFHRREILYAAYALYEENDVNNVTMREVQKKSEYPMATIYNYFRSKEELFFELSTSIMEAKGVWLFELIDKEPNSIKKLFKYFYANFEYLKKYPVELKMMIQYQAFKGKMDNISEEFVQEQNNRRRKMHRTISNIYITGMKDGSFREDLNIEHIHDLVLISLRQAMHRIIIMKDVDDDFFWELVKLLLRSIALPKKGKEIDQLLSQITPDFDLPEKVELADI